ncbi:MAG: hypothetical protein AVDCRST_MAG85-3908 [uncultured Solirubrobacteraceae bacterium]|uniref:Methyltransferase type 11 domain-containing protein n=1 Tax=uncultured Solirubrobacteraceae bacterium TaxID=1162706 RepID=A0A6J4TWV3_9ACTN|nr:MAG: hypothetical protein AVDCRST_MAG85-3908 [uncultured Solirubrobacteraceae bacterium]
MLEAAADRIATVVDDADAVLQVGAAVSPFERADWVLDDEPYEPNGSARYSRTSWVTRDVCGREPWPFADGRFAFAVCTSLALARDPIGVCAELSRVARAGYVEVPTIEAELAGGSARWLCDVSDAELVFVHKDAALLSDPRVRVPARWSTRLEASDRVTGLFWDARLPARERLVDTPTLAGELAERLRQRFEPTTAEVALVEARRLGGMAGSEVWRRLDQFRSR